MAKSTKRVVISDSSLNKYGFRLLTSGADLSQYRKNPILLFMHQRAFGKEDGEVLPLGYVEDVQIEGDVISGTPVFDDNDEFAKKIENKWENGTYRMASAGVNVLGVSDKPEDILPGQKFATVNKWRLEEVSIVDIGANNNALAFYDKGQKLQLAAGEMPAFISEIKNPDNTMNKFAALFAKLNLAADAGEDKLVAEVETRMAQMETLSKENTELKASIATIEANQKKEKVVTLIDKAVSEKRILPTQKEFYVKLAENDFETTEKLLASIPAYKSVQSQMNEKKDETSDKFLKMSWDELDKSNKLADLKSHDPEIYREKFKEKFGKEPLNQ